MNKLTFRAWRRIAAWLQAAIILLLPFARIHGESALRFDIPSLKLYFFGSVIWISEAYFYLLVFLLFFIGVMLFTVLYGRIWCGWMCPQTVLSGFARSMDAISAWFTGHRALRSMVSHALLLLFSAIVSISLIWYFVSPYELFKDIITRSVGPWTFWSWAIFTLLIYLDLAFLRQKFCGTVCPYAGLQSAFFDDRTLTISFDQSRAGECMGCDACVRACPSGIDIRNGIQVECINCAECIDSCSRQRDRVGKKSLITYVRGNAGSAIQKGPRARVLGLSVVLAALSVLLAYQINIRIPVDFWVLRDESQPYKQVNARGDMLNAFVLVVENRSLHAAAYQLSVSGVKDAKLLISRNPVLIGPNSVFTSNVYVIAERKNLTDRVTTLRFTLKNTASGEIKVSQEASFIYPERTDKEMEI